MPRYHFDDFVLSPRRRLLLRGGEEQPLIPRYFDLLVFLVEHRHEAVHRRDIFDRVWSDANVSDSALSQAIRTIRRALGDDPRDARFIRTVSRHGYRFVYGDVHEEEEDEGVSGPVLVTVPGGDAATGPAASSSPMASSDGTGDWAGAAAGGGLAGVMGGAFGGLILASAPGSAASLAVVPVLALIGGCCGAAGGAGVGAGMAAAESVARSGRTVALVVGAAAGGAFVGTVVQWLSRWSLAALVGVRLDVGGGVEGLAIGAAAGLGYGVATAGKDAARDDRRRVAVVTAAACGVAGLLLTGAGWPLVGGTIHVIATASDGAQVALTPLGRLIGETDFGPLSSAIVGTGEAVLFGLGLALGLTRRR